MLLKDMTDEGSNGDRYGGQKGLCSFRPKKNNGVKETSMVEEGEN